MKAVRVTAFFGAIHSLLNDVYHDGVVKAWQLNWEQRLHAESTGSIIRISPPAFGFNAAMQKRLFDSYAHDGWVVGFRVRVECIAE